jgi:hypothetical protein
LGKAAISVWLSKTTHYIQNMKNIVRSFIALVIAAGSFAYGAVPSLSVTVSDSAGKVAFKGGTNSKGTFATGTLKPGKYAVQFQSSGGNVNGASYAVVISAGTKKVTADSVDGAKFSKGGVAMNIEVGSGLNVSGQVSEAGATKVDKNGKKMVWIPQKLGSNLPAHWASEDSAEAKEAKTQGSYSTKNIQDKQNQGISPH